MNEMRDIVKAQTELPNRLAYVSLFCMMAISFCAGFLHPVPSNENSNLHRIHVFLFNLCAGGTLILWYSIVERQNILI